MCFYILPNWSIILKPVENTLIFGMVIVRILVKIMYEGVRSQSEFRLKGKN